MLEPALDGWKAETIGDDIAWLRFGPDGRLYAVNPKPDSSASPPAPAQPPTPTRSPPSRTATRSSPTSPSPTTATCGGKDDRRGARSSHRLGRRDGPRRRRSCRAPELPLLHPHRAVPHRRPRMGLSSGVPISAILFGGRRASTVPLVTQSLSWQHGCSSPPRCPRKPPPRPPARSASCAATRWRCCRSSATTSATTSALARHRRERKPGPIAENLHVNWFRRGDDGRFLWPGFGDNSASSNGRCSASRAAAPATRTPIGWVPTPRRTRPERAQHHRPRPGHRTDRRPARMDRQPGS